MNEADEGNGRWGRGGRKSEEGCGGVKYFAGGWGRPKPKKKLNPYLIAKTAFTHTFFVEPHLTHTSFSHITTSPHASATSFCGATSSIDKHPSKFTLNKPTDRNDWDAIIFPLCHHSDQTPNSARI
jgi:hypothetical protein